jgi:DNA polymerase II
MNSFYGVLGTSGCRFLDSRLVSSITRRGHQIIVDSKKFIERQGYRVIYGDTDSLFVLTGAENADTVGAIGRSLADLLNQWWSKRLSSSMKLESCLEIEFETHYSKFLMPTVRGSDTGSKKRYAGLVRYSGNSIPPYKMTFKGLETVRSDWSPLARKFQQRLYEKVFLDEPFEDYIKQVITAVANGEHHDDLVLRRRLRRNLEDYVKNVPPHVQAARKAEKIRQDRGLPSQYAYGGWIEYLMTMNGPEPRQYQRSDIDYDFYIDRQITPIADSILVFKSSSVKELLDRQIGLFQAEEQQ